MFPVKSSASPNNLAASLSSSNVIESLVQNTLPADSVSSYVAITPVSSPLPKTNNSPLAGPGEPRPTLILVTVSSVVTPFLLALSLNACQVAGWEIAEPHVRENTNKQVQFFTIFFIVVGFKSLLAERETPTSPPDASQAFFKK
jgi:hypothetical protein